MQIRILQPSSELKSVADLLLRNPIRGFWRLTTWPIASTIFWIWFVAVYLYAAGNKDFIPDKSLRLMIKVVGFIWLIADDEG